MFYVFMCTPIKDSKFKFGDFITMNELSNIVSMATTFLPDKKQHINVNNSYIKKESIYIPSFNNFLDQGMTLMLRLGFTYFVT